MINMNQQNNNSIAFSLFRFTSYFSLLIYYFLFKDLNLESWNDINLHNLYQPISFFKLIPYDSLFIISGKTIYIIWFFSMVYAGIGFLFPITSSLAFFTTLFLTGVPQNFGKVHNSDHLPCLVLCIFMFSMHSGILSFDNLLFKAKSFYKKFKPDNWVIESIILLNICIYFTAGFQKLRYSGIDWIFSDNLATVLINRKEPTSLALTIAQSNFLSRSIAFFVICLQLSSPLILIFKRYTIFWIIGIICFHLGNYYFLKSDGFFFSYIICLLAFLPWQILANKLTRLQSTF